MHAFHFPTKYNNLICSISCLLDSYKVRHYGDENTTLSRATIVFCFFGKWKKKEKEKLTNTTRVEV